MTLNVFLSHLKYILQLSLVKFSVLLTIFWDRMGRADTHFGGHMDRQIFLRNYYLRFTSNVFSVCWIKIWNIYFQKDNKLRIMSIDNILVA